MIVAAFAIVLSAVPAEPLQVTLGDGTVVKLLSVSADSGAHAWTPGGDPAPAMPIWEAYKPAPPAPSNSSLTSSNPERSYLLEIEPKIVPPSPDDWAPSVEIEGLEAGPLFEAPADPYGPKDWSFVRTSKIDPNATEGDLDFLVSASAWKTVKVAKYKKGKAVSGNSFAADVAELRTLQNPKYRLDQPVQLPSLGFPLMLPDMPGSEIQVSAYKSDGEKIPPAGFTGSPYVDPPKALAGVPGHFVLEDFTGDANAVAEVRIEVRPWVKAHFSHIQFAPKAPAISAPPPKKAVSRRLRT